LLPNPEVAEEDILDAIARQMEYLRNNDRC
jgi:sulfur relay (sulfurtransferase) DsrC/TusE family protein